MSPINEPVAAVADLDEKLGEKMAAIIAKALKYARFSKKNSSYEKNALFLVTAAGEKSLTVNQIGEMSSDKYNEYAKLLATEVARISSEETTRQQNNIVSSLITCGKILVLVGQEELLGQACLMVAAVKSNLLSEDEALRMNNDFFEMLWQVEENWNSL